MSLRGRWGAIFVLVLVFLATIGLFYYINQIKRDSVLTLQTKLQEMEIQRVEEDKGNQTNILARKVAEELNAFIEKTQKSAESLADSEIFRQPHSTPSQKRAKAKAFLQLTKKDTQWTLASLTDESGNILATTSPQPQASLSENPEIRQAIQQHMTILGIQERPEHELFLQITVPCLNQAGEFLGVMQVEKALAPALQEQMLKSKGMFTLLATASGRRLTPAAQANFPNNLGALIGKNLQEMETFVTRPAATYFKANWSGTRYLVSSAETRIPGIRVFVLLEVSGLEKFLGTHDTPESLFKDPLLIGGLALTFILGLGLMFFFGGESKGQLQNLSRQLAKLAEPDAELLPISLEAGKDWQKLADYLNLVIERAGAQPPKGGMDPAQLEQMNAEIAEARDARNHLAAQNQELAEKLNEVTKKSRDLLQQLQNQELQISEEKSRQMEQASKIRIEAIVNMSEDLKATLTVIKNYISSILASEDSKITDAQQEFLGVVINKSARLERQINDLLDLSHLESEASQMFLAPTDIAAMLQDVVLNVQPQADTKQIRLVEEIPAQLPNLMINSDRLGQVFINLIQHALRITPVNGVVKLAVEHSGQEILIRIIDGGTPLTPEQEKLMFDSFHGPDSQAGPGLAGTGLRFAIVKGIVDAHKGTIAITGLKERGNEIAIKIPVDIREAAAGAEKPSGHTGEQGTTETQTSKDKPVAGWEEETSGINETYFSLSTLMPDDDAKSILPEKGEELDDLLRDIESINDKMEHN